MDTAFTRLVGIRHPIVQTGMGWVAGPRLVSATAEAGALGVLASATMTLGQLRDAVREVRSRTDAPFGVNLRADAGDAGDRVRIIIDEGVRVASFALAPSRELIAELKEAGVVVIPSVGARRHAEKVAAWGADAVIVQGGEGGGHTGEVATTVLLPQVVDAVDIPVVAAGGFHDGRGLVAALAYGAAGVAMGTRFLLTSDSTVPDAVKARYLAATVKDVTVTTAVDGLPHRMLRTDFVDSLEVGPYEGSHSGRPPGGRLQEDIRTLLACHDPRRPRDEARQEPVLEPGPPRRQHAHAAQVRDGGRAYGPRGDGLRAGRRGDRRPALVHRAGGPDHDRGGGDVEVLGAAQSRSMMVTFA